MRILMALIGFFSLASEDMNLAPLRASRMMGGRSAVLFRDIHYIPGMTPPEIFTRKQMGELIHQRWQDHQKTG